MSNERMPNELLQNFRVAILATDGFEQAELEKPREALKEAGAAVTVIAPKSGEIQGMNHAEKGRKVEVDLTLDKARPEDFDAVLLPGGVANADNLRVEPKAQEFVRAIEKAGKPIAVICHGPWLLVSAGLVKGRHLTSYHTLRDDLRNAGAQWTDEETVLDRNWISSRKPDDIPAFNRGIIELFAKSGKKTRTASSD